MSETADWPVTLRGVTESVVTTLGPNDRWNVAALGLHAPETDVRTEQDVTARTWGRTRTWRNFDERGGGYVQFTRDPVDFTEAAMTIREEADPVIDSADAWVRVDVEERDAGTEAGTQWVEWTLRPVESAIERELVSTTNRGYYAVVEATIAASRLEVPSYDRETLLDRLAYFEAVVDRCGGDRDREAFEIVTREIDANLP